MKYSTVLMFNFGALLDDFYKMKRTTCSTFSHMLKYLSIDKDRDRTHTRGIMERPRRKRKPELAPGQSIHVRWPENGRDYKATVRRVAGGKVKVVYRDESYEDLNLELASDRDRIVEGSGSGARCWRAGSSTALARAFLRHDSGS